MVPTEPMPITDAELAGAMVVVVAVVLELLELVIDDVVFDVDDVVFDVDDFDDEDEPLDEEDLEDLDEPRGELRDGDLRFELLDLEEEVEDDERRLLLLQDFESSSLPFTSHLLTRSFFLSALGSGCVSVKALDTAFAKALVMAVFFFFSLSSSESLDDSYILSEAAKHQSKVNTGNTPVG